MSVNFYTKNQTGWKRFFRCIPVIQRILLYNLTLLDTFNYIGSCYTSFQHSFLTMRLILHGYALL